LALNMMDEVRASGNSIDTQRLSELLKMPVVPISAAKKEGVSFLVEQVKTLVENGRPAQRLDFCSGEVHKAVHAIRHIIEPRAEKEHIPPRFAATKLVEGDEPMRKRLDITENEEIIIGCIVEDMEISLGTDREAALADMRYSFIEDVSALCVTKRSETKEQLRSEKIDRVLTHKVFGIPIFIGIMLLIFWLTFSVLGAPLQDLLDNLITLGSDALAAVMERANVSSWVISLTVDGVCAGVGSVLSFLPIILLLFFFLSMLEDSGYMARVAFVMDKLLRKLGLSGRSFVPMLVGFGCSVPAIMSARTLSGERDRRLTILITPFMSCGAKLPIYAMITAAFFPKHAPLVMVALYVTGIIAAILTGLLMKKTLMKGEPVPFVMELPAYRIPSARSVLMLMWEKAKDFIVKAFTVIFAASVIIWLLQSIDWGLNPVADSADSILASIGSVIAPVFAPLGFGDWRASTALITGITAKESVVSTLTVLTSSATEEALYTALGGVFTPLSAFSFLVFTLLYMPCVAAFAAMKREIGLKRALFSVGYETAFAYVAALLVYQIGSLFIG
ncbi:MAG: ferrous iron transport protein B, partial [Oscillospiraceae bacterium]